MKPTYDDVLEVLFKWYMEVYAPKSHPQALEAGSDHEASARRWCERMASVVKDGGDPHNIARPYGFPAYYDNWLKTKGTMPRKTVTTTPVPTSAVWALVEKVLPYSSRTLLYGPPGTGKTYAGTRKGLRMVTVLEGVLESTKPQPVYNVYLTPETPAAELRGFYHPQPDEATGAQRFVWIDGPVTAAWRNGGRLVLNEINLASNDCMSLMLNILDDVDSAQMVLPTKEVLYPHPNFCVVATMNGDPKSELMPALRDRFPVAIQINEVHPEAITALPADIQKAAVNTGLQEDPERRVSVRTWSEFARLRTAGLAELDAAQACFGTRAEDVVNALTLARA